MMRHPYETRPMSQASHAALMMLSEVGLPDDPLDYDTLPPLPEDRPWMRDDDWLERYGNSDLGDR